MHDTALITDLAIILSISAIVTIIFQKIKQPLVLGYIIAGLIIGPHSPPFSLITEEAEITTLAQLGVVFLMFFLGLEFNFKKIVNIGFPPVFIGFFEVACMILIGYGAGGLLGWDSYDRFLLGAAISISSTTIIIKALENLRLKSQPFAPLMIAILLVDDMLAILLLVFVATSAEVESAFSEHVLAAAGNLFLNITCWVLLGYLVIPYIMRKIEHYVNHETLTVISCGLCLLLSAIAIHFNYSAALGAFIMGSILSVAPQAKKIETLILPIRDVFAAVFFVSVGMLINPQVLFDYLPYVLLFSAITIAGKCLTTSIGALITGQSPTTAITIGFSMAQIGEFSFIIVGIGSSIAATSDSLYPIVVAISAITTFATPYMMRFSANIGDTLEKHFPPIVTKILINYRGWVNRAETVESRRFGKSNALAKFTTNAIVVAILYSTASRCIQPFSLSWPKELLAWSICVILSAPFIWAMLFAKMAGEKQELSLMRILFWIATVAIVTLLVKIDLHNQALILPLGVLLIVMLTYFQKPISNIYYRLEKQLRYNILNDEDRENELFYELIPYDSELARITVANSFPFLAKSLEEAELRSTFGITIVAIKRSESTIWLPNSRERIFPGDELMLLGTKEDISQFTKFTKQNEVSYKRQPNEQIRVTKIAIDSNPALINQTIKGANSENLLNGLVVRIERNGQKMIHPNPTTLLKSGDVLVLLTKDTTENKTT